uniref:Uncharacterized protein n=1 Tax=Nelumbo nucifera TaxID=4432 RepID=A0A822Y380_NELNU|nr:TPA_asm: hypothetical protein HUJ06_025551 [Nelumbo nucifera]
MESETHLKPPTANLRRMQTYSVTWVNSATKLCTCVDRVGCKNPT